jgi:hypothetical protein
MEKKTGEANIEEIKLLSVVFLWMEKPSMYIISCLPPQGLQLSARKPGESCFKLSQVRMGLKSSLASLKCLHPITHQNWNRIPSKQRRQN